MNSAHKMNQFSEQHLLRVASEVCGISEGDILLIGGGTVLPETAGYKRLRPRSNDLDFIVNDSGLEQVVDALDTQSASVLEVPGIGDETHYTHRDSVFLAFFHGFIRGYEVPEDAYSTAIVRETSQGKIYMINPELNVAMKIRRGASKGKIYGKDGLDFATTVSGLDKAGRRFDADVWTRYMQQGVCESCILGSPYQCLDQLAVGTTQLPRADRASAQEVVGDLKMKAEHFCTYRGS